MRTVYLLPRSWASQKETARPLRDATGCGIRREVEREETLWV